MACMKMCRIKRLEQEEEEINNSLEREKSKSVAFEYTEHKGAFIQNIITLPLPKFVLSISFLFSPEYKPSKILKPNWFCREKKIQFEKCSLASGLGIQSC